MNDDTLHPVIDYWNTKAAAEANDCARIESGQRAQRMRFENFVIHHDLVGGRILDVGCGVGDFYDHLKRRGVACGYHGVDIADQMVTRCRERFPEALFEVADVTRWEPAEPCDYVVSFAIHNVRMEGGRALLESVTRRQFELCRKAAHVSLLTDRYPGFDAHIQPWRAEEILTLALSITPYVVLRHDYLPNDFSVTLYREPLIDTRGDLFLPPRTP
jgi:SAM-dependent methyltransferase